MQTGVYPVLTLLDDLDEVVGVEAELVRVLGVVGVQRPALGHLGAGLGRGLGAAAAGGGPAGGGPVGPGDTGQNNNSTLVGFVLTAVRGLERGGHCSEVCLTMPLLVWV